MPAEVVTGRFCASWFASYDIPSSKPGKSYRCSLSGTHGPYCPCKSFEFSPLDSRNCRHIEQIHREACLWNVQWHEGNNPILLRPVAYDSSYEIPNDTCPNCGGPVIAVKIAV